MHFRFTLALNAEQKQIVFNMLAAGKTATEAADAVGCSRATIQRLKKNSKSDPLLQMARGIAATKQISEQGNQVLATLDTLKEREPQLQEGLWLMFKGLSGLFQQVLEQTDPAEVSPRQLPGLAKSAADIAIAYADYADRINGLEAIACEIEKINGTRAA